MTRALVMAGGEDAAWGNHLGVRRHLAPFMGERLLPRIVRQLTQRGVDALVIGDDIAPVDRRWGREALNGIDWWSDTERTLQVYGDVVFTEAAMDTICGFTDRRWQAFGRHGPGGVSPYGELFAISFWPEHREAWRAAMERAIDMYEAGASKRAGSWEGYRLLAGGDPDEHRLYPDLFTDIDDLTDDIDTPAEYEAMLRLWE